MIRLEVENENYQGRLIGAGGVYAGGDACRELSGEKKDEMARLEKIRLKEVEVRVMGLLDYWGCLDR